MRALWLILLIASQWYSSPWTDGAKSKHHRLVFLTAKEFSDWYSKQEIDCMNDVPGSGPCAITENCRPPLQNRTFWKRGIQGFTYPREHTIINLWTQLWGHKRNVTIIFIGDFSTKQRIHFMNLDTARYMGADFVHSVDTKEEAADEVGNHFRAYFSSKELNSTVVIRHIHLTKDESTSGHSNHSGHSSHSSHASHTGHTGQAGISNHELASRILDRVNFIERSNALVLIHMGEAFTHETLFQHELRLTMDWLNTVAQRTEVRNKVVWLTSWPQHYPHSAQGNGYFHGSAASVSAHGGSGKVHGYSCVPRTNITNDWRNTLLLKMLADPLYQHMELFDDRDLMGPLYDMHKGGGDCTHLCYSPVMHQLLWDAISRYVEHYESLDP